jgi:hypothetical protein
MTSAPATIIPRLTVLGWGRHEQGVSPFTGAITTHTRFTDNIVRVGLNYKFGDYYAPVVTK